ncbi:MAG: hypothetical protein K2X01_03720 [Cyanobacteria bacterium]|nr:hypothetical protein [Cyanobacteriota bacterium]
MKRTISKNMFRLCAVFLLTSVVAMPPVHFSALAEELPPLVPNPQVNQSPANQPDALSGAEMQLLNQTFIDSPLEERLSRLETLIYGSTQSGTPAQRQERLLKILAKTEQSTPQNSAHNAQNTAVPSKTAGNHSGSRATALVEDYPALTLIERRVFARDFVGLDINNRLDRVERKVFNQNFPQLSLADRMDRLQKEVPVFGQAPASNNPILRQLPDNPDEFVSSSHDAYGQISELEQDIFRGKTFPDKLITQRLDALEAKLYGRPFSGESVDHRISRLLIDWQRRQNPNYQQPVPANQYFNPVIPQNRPLPPGRYSAYGFTQTPSTVTPESNFQYFGPAKPTRSLSPEILNMLPNDVRQNLAQQGISSGNGVTTQQYTNQILTSPGQVITQNQSQTQYLPYGGTMITTTESYGGQQTTILPNTVYTGTLSPTDPEVISTLNNLEIQLFGTASPPTTSISTRLSLLETKLTGQSLSGLGYTEQDRLSQLIRTAQAQQLGRSLGNGKLGKIGRSLGSVLMGVPLNPPQNGINTQSNSGALGILNNLRQIQTQNGVSAP